MSAFSSFLSDCGDADGAAAVASDEIEEGGDDGESEGAPAKPPKSMKRPASALLKKPAVASDVVDPEVTIHINLTHDKLVITMHHLV
jgi:hypothetical protein